MEPSLNTPKSLVEFKKRDEEIKAFEDFKETEPRIHRGFKEATRYDKERVEFRTLTSRPNTDILQQHLLSTFSGKSGEADLKAKADSLDWDGLLELYAEKITENDKSKAKDSSFRNFLRKERGLPSTLHGLTEVIPDDYGLSVLRVGLAYIFLAWKRHIDSRNMVLETLANVPLLLASVYNKREPYEEDQGLLALVGDFRTMLLHSLIRLAEIISPSQHGKTQWVKRAWKKLTEQESQDVNEITNQISAAMTKISERIDELLHQRVANLERLGEKSLKSHNESYRQLQEVIARLQELKTIREQDESQRTQPPRVTVNIQNPIFFLIPPDMASLMQTGLYNIVTEDRWIEHQQLWPETSQIVRPRTPVMAVVLVTNQELVRILRVQETGSSAEMDMKYVLRRSNSMEQRGLSQARSLMTKDAFKSLLAKDESGILMVDGHCKEDGAGKTSPLSVWSASFAASLMQSDSVVVLHYFCGLHSRSIEGDPVSGPLRLIKSLIEQLVRQAGDHVSRMGTLDKALAQQVMENSFEAITGLLKPLLMTLDPGKTVFIIIDNVSEFEGVTWNEWSEQMLCVFRTLYDIVKDPGIGMRLKIKVFMTSANKSTTLGRRVEDNEIVSLY